MIYRINVDGKELITEVLLDSYSREADNRAREKIIDHYLEEKRAKNIIIETVLSVKELVNYAYDKGYKAVTVMGCGNVRAFPDAYAEWCRLWQVYQEDCHRKGKKAVQEDFLKLIYGMKGNCVDENGKIYPVLIYTKNENGIRNLYKIVTASYLKYFNNNRPTIPTKLLDEHREGLLIYSENKNTEVHELFTGDLPEQTDYISPLRHGRYLPTYPDAEIKLRRICERKIKELYGAMLPANIRQRMERELDAVCINGYAGLFMMWRDLVKKSLEKGYPTGIRGAVGSSLIAFLCGITEINPLPAEYRGYDIPSEVFMGIRLDKEPDIDINFAPDIKETIQDFVKELPGVGETCYGGTYCVKNGKEHVGMHPGGIIVCPEGEELLSFTPLMYSPHGKNKITHFDYHTISNNLLKLDVLGHNAYDLLYYLQETTGLNVRDVPLDDDKVLSMICDPDILLIKDLPEFGAEYVRRMIAETKAASFTDLIKINAISHGTEVWYGNQEEVIRAGIIKLSDCISSRDDILLYLMDRNIDRNTAYHIMEYVRKGRGLKTEHKKIMENAGIPEWYIKACTKIKYLFPKAHAVSATMMAVRLGYYMFYYPEAYREGLSAVN